MLIFILYDGTSVDGRGTGNFLKATESKEEALVHYKNIKLDPYSIGKVQVLTEDIFNNILTEAQEIKYFGKVVKRKGRK